MKMSLSKLLGIKEDPIEVEEKYKKPTINPFDFVSAIQFSKEDLITDDWSEKQYNPFIINKALSFSPDTVLYANEMNERGFLDKKLQFDFLMGSVRKKKRFDRWIKQDVKEESLELVKQYYGYSRKKAESALRILSPKQLAEIKIRMDKGGTYQKDK
jgi:hypothetical protein